MWNKIEKQKKKNRREEKNRIKSVRWTLNGRKEQKHNENYRQFRWEDNHNRVYTIEIEEQ